MKIVDDNIKNALKKPTTQRKGRILINGTYYDVYNVEYYADAYNEGNVIGNTIASQLNFDIPYISKFNNFKYFDGVWTDFGYEYVDMGTFTVFDEKDEDEFTKHITAFDNLIKFNVPFVDKGGYPKTLYQELLNICEQAGVSLLNTNIPNKNFQVVNNQFVSGESLKTVLKSICSITGTFATIKNDMLVLQLKNTTNEVINKSQHEPVIWKRKSYGINQVIIGDATIEGEYVIKQDNNDIALNGVHKLVINGNLFAWTQEKRQQLIDELFNQVRGFGYIPYELKGEWLSYLEVGDTINIDGTDTIVLRVNGKSPKALESEMSAPAIIDSSIEYVDNTNDVQNQLQRTERSVDKQNLVIRDVVEQTTEQNRKIAEVTQTVEELNSKISDIADITISAEDTDAKIELNEINESEPIRLVVRPVGEDISNLLISSNMLISDKFKLKQRVIRFTNTKTNENFDYKLPADLLYYDNENYDEFILDYDGQSCVVNKKVVYNADGTKRLLDKMTTVPYEYPKIVLTEGDYVVSILGYDTGYLFARLMSKNIYTTQFYTKAEVDSEIKQTAESIDLSVNQKLSNYSTTNEMNSAISLKANEITESVSETYTTKETTSQLSSKVTQNSTSIASEVNRATNTENSLSSRITQTSDSLISEITNRKNADTTLQSSIKQTADNLSSEITARTNGDKELSSKISQNATDITAEVKRATNKENSLNANIQLKLDTSKLVTQLNASADIINIKGNRFILDSTNFKVSQNGTIKATNGEFSGKITATNGYIGSWNIGISAIEYEASTYKVTIAPGTNENKDFLVVYNKSNNTYPFFVRADGYFSASNVNISGSVTGSSISGSSISGGSINIQKGNYYFNMGLSTDNPSCSGLNVGNYGIKAHSDITATGFAITDSDTGKSYSIGIRDYSGHVHYLTFTGGILTAWEYV